MLRHIRLLLNVLPFAVVIAAGIASFAIAQDTPWRVSKSSGEVWISAPGVQSVLLTDATTLTPGSTVRTGANGRVLLSRGAETIMVSPNSVMEIPVAKEGGSGLTRVLQQSGQLLFDVEKKNVRHFEVATPYLAAVVKGTQFRVSVDEIGSRVEVLRGQVQVMDFKSGQRALVNPDQKAEVLLHGNPGLALSGAGSLSPIEFGRPQVSPVSPLLETEMRAAAATASGSSQGNVMRPSTQPGSGGSNAAPQTSPIPQSVAITTTRPKQPDGGTNIAWADRVGAWLRGTSPTAHQRKGDDNMTLLAIPLLVGLSVAASSIFMRRRRKGSPQDPRGRG
jgi:hypothetical protein